MPFSSRLFGALVTKRAFLAFPTPPVRLRYDPKWTKSLVHRYSTQRSLVPAGHNRGVIVQRSSIQTNIPRSFSTLPRSRTRRIAGFILKASLTGTVLYLCWIVGTFASAYWHNMNPPFLSGWPEDTRNHLITARFAIYLALKDQILDSLEGAWKAAQRIPVESFNPNPSVKILSVAIWYSDRLEKAGNARKAYAVLSEAVDLYQSRLKTRSSSISPADIEERCYFISVLIKLASLTETCEPAAEGKWVSYGLREIMPLLPLCQGIPEKVYDIIAGSENLAIADPCFSGISLQPNPSYDTSASAAASEKDRISSSRDQVHVIPVDEVIPEDDCLFPPIWHLQDPNSAISLAIDRLGVFAVKQMDYRLANAAYQTAIPLLQNQRTFREAAPDERLLRLETSIRMLGIMNHDTELILRLLEMAHTSEIWLRILKVAAKQDVIISHLLNECKDYLGDNIKAITQKRGDRMNSYCAEFALTSGHRAILLEKMGRAEEAIKSDELALQLWKLSVHHARLQRMEDVQEHIRTSKQAISEGKASLKEQMNSMISKAAQKRAEEELEDKNTLDTSTTLPT